MEELQRELPMMAENTVHIMMMDMQAVKAEGHWEEPSDEWVSSFSTFDDHTCLSLMHSSSYIDNVLECKW